MGTTDRIYCPQCATLHFTLQHYIRLHRVALYRTALRTVYLTVVAQDGEITRAQWLESSFRLRDRHQIRTLKQKYRGMQSRVQEADGEQ
jgi:hypothetical protein